MKFLKSVSEKKFPMAIQCMAFLFIGTAIFLTLVRTPLDNKNTIMTIEIPRGSSFVKVTGILSEAGLVRNRLAFYLFARLKDAPRHIRAGEYELTSSMAPTVILDKLMRGEIKGYRVPVPEGSSIRQIASVLVAQKLVDEKEFLRLCRDADFLKSLGINGKSAEGYLFPETYIITKSMTEKEIIALMVDQFRKRITPEMIRRAEALGFTFDQILTISSMIEKEAKINREKPLIAAVFYNRLRNSMRLQSDPTAVYDMVEFVGPITREHLRRNSPYNTYQINGLPPGPIANPGLESIKAALYPADVDYLYFVARNDGSHQFSTNLARHNAAVLKFIIKREKY